MADIRKCNNKDCKTIVTECRTNGQYKKYCCSPCRRLGIAEKCKQTSLKKYGVSNPSKSKMIKTRIKESFIEKYGEGITNAMHIQKFKDKIVETNVERHGTDKPQLLEEFENKSKKTCLEKYGVEKPQRLQLLKDKSSNTCLERYGVSAPQKNKTIQQKSVDKCIEKYGVSNSAQDPLIHEKTIKKMYRSKSYILPDNSVVTVQGYEPFAIDYLLNMYDQCDIKISTLDKPRITYFDEAQKKHYYFPDIYIPKDNIIVEVKSLWTYNKNIPRHCLKQQACLDAGYNFKFMIFDKNGNLLDISIDK